MSRSEKILVGRQRHFIKCFDNGGKSYDRYTVFYHPVRYELHPGCKRTYYPYIGMSEDPFHPQGFGQHGECPMPPKEGKALGHRIKFADLPQPCQRAVLLDLAPE